MDITKYLYETKFLQNFPPKPYELTLALKTYGFSKYGKHLDISDIKSKIMDEIQKSNKLVDKIARHSEIKTEPEKFIHTDIKVDEILENKVEEVSKTDIYNTSEVLNSETQEIPKIPEIPKVEEEVSEIPKVEEEVSEIPKVENITDDQAPEEISETSDYQKNRKDWKKKNK